MSMKQCREGACSLSPMVLFGRSLNDVLRLMKTTKVQRLLRR